MKIRCIYNLVSDLPQNLVGENRSCNEYTKFDISLNKEYIVYAMIVMDDIVWYFICGDHFEVFPVLVPCPLFEIIDNRLSRYWVFDCTPIKNNSDFYCIWSFSEWISDLQFYNKLTDWEPEEKKLFAEYKRKMDLEFPDSSVRVSAEVGDQDWLMCPLCIDAWHYSSDRDALVVCPKCHTVETNPRYKQS